VRTKATLRETVQSWREFASSADITGKPEIEAARASAEDCAKDLSSYINSLDALVEKFRRNSILINGAKRYAYAEAANAIEEIVGERSAAQSRGVKGDGG